MAHTFTVVKRTAARVPSFDAAAHRVVTNMTAPHAVSLIDQSGISSAATSDRVAWKNRRLMYSL